MSNRTGEHTSYIHKLSDEELSNATGGAFNAFSNFGDIKGESTDKDHKDWIMLAGTENSSPRVSEIAVTKRMDRASL